MSSTAAESYVIYRRKSVLLFTGLAAMASAAALVIAGVLLGPLWLVAPAGVIASFGLAALLGLRGSRTPVFVADDHGVRLIEREGWVGLLWRDIEALVVEPGIGLGDPIIKLVAHGDKRIHAIHIGFTTTASLAEAETQLARRRAAAPY